MEKIVIFGGSFDPIHNGHLRLARAASLLLNADVVFVPAKEPRWKKPDSKASDRVKMLQLALNEERSGAFAIDLCEMKRPGTSYSIDTAKDFVKRYPGRELYWLIGSDQVNKLPKWKDPKNLSELVHFVYVPRSDILVDPAIVQTYGVLELDYHGSGPVSSSDIRELKSLDLPLKVLEYIENNNLYFMKKVSSYISGHRLAHSLSVAHLAYAIAQKNQLPHPEHAYIAGLLHDLGKHLEPEETAKIMAEAYPEYQDYPAYCLHQFTGCYLAQKEFGVTDEDILDAIEFHCTGKAHMPPLSKIIYASDKIDPTRGYDSSKMIDRCLKNYYVGFLNVLKENEKFLAKNGEGEENPLSESCRNLYLGERKKK